MPLIINMGKDLVLYGILIGFSTLLIPNVFADVYVHESEYPFSIQHPSEWKVSAEDEWGGVNFDSDDTGRNGMYVILGCSEYRGEDCGIAGADYEELNWLKEDEKMFCNESTLEEDYILCSDLKFLDEYAHQINGYRAFTVVVSYELYQDGGDPIYPAGMGLHEGMGTTTYVLVGNDIWLIGTSNDVEQFDLETHEKIISTFKINNIYDQDDLFSESESSWIDNLIKAIMSLFNWGSDSNSNTNTVIEQPSEVEYQPEQQYQDPIYIELEFDDFE